VAALPGLHQIVLPTPWDVGPVQIYLIEGDPLTLVDTGVRTPASRACLESALAALGRRLDEVQRIVLTHYHGDHLGQAETIRAAGRGLEVLVHADDAAMCEDFSAEKDENIEGTEALFREYGVDEDLLRRQTAVRRKWIQEDPLCDATPVDRRLHDGDRIPCQDFELEVIHSPGHTAGHILLYEERSGTLLTGDHIMGNAVPFTDTYYVEQAAEPSDGGERRSRFRGLVAYLASLRRLRGGSFRTILPAHGGIIDAPSRAIDEALLFYELRVHRTERALHRLARRGRAATAWAIWQTLFPKTDPIHEMRRRMLMVIGALDALEEAGRIETTRHADGTLVHAPVVEHGA
jgi:glyoxylase-like metal-dependent hydrolase (beta-lactamase superfamily II)